MVRGVVGASEASRSDSFQMTAQTVDAAVACSLLAGVSKPKVFLGR